MTKKLRWRSSPAVLQRAKELRQHQTPAESQLWAVLRNRQLEGLKFRRQHPIGRFVVDFYCTGRRLVIEVDGASHKDQVEYDQDRTAWLEEQGYRVIRFPNEQILHQLDAVLDEIMAVCGDGTR